MTWTELQTFLKGKVFLIGLTFVDQDNELIEQYQTSGMVDELTDDGLFRFKRADGSFFQLPYENETINEAAKGEYRERATGNIIINPDYITSWEIQVSRTDNIENMKQNGYTPAK